MLKGWNRKVRITRAIKRAWTTTRMVSPNPLSDFVPDVTLMAFLLPRRDSPRGGRTFPSRESMFAPRQENGLASDVVGAFRLPEFALLRYSPRRFRRLFATAQSTALLKLPNILTNMTF
jgi:hypothetical protein